MPRHVEPVAELDALERKLALVNVAVRRARDAVAKCERQAMFTTVPVIADVVRLADAATDAVLRHVEVERNLVRDQLHAAVVAAMAAAMVTRISGEVCANAEREHRAGNRVIPRRQISPV